MEVCRVRARSRWPGFDHHHCWPSSTRLVLLLSYRLHTSELVGNAFGLAFVLYVWDGRRKMHRLVYRVELMSVGLFCGSILLCISWAECQRIECSFFKDKIIKGYNFQRLNCSFTYLDLEKLVVSNCVHLAKTKAASFHSLRLN